MSQPFTQSATESSFKTSPGGNYVSANASATASSLISENDALFLAKNIAKGIANDVVDRDGNILDIVDEKIEKKVSILEKELTINLDVKNFNLEKKTNVLESKIVNLERENGETKKDLLELHQDTNIFETKILDLERENGETKKDLLELHQHTNIFKTKILDLERETMQINNQTQSLYSIITSNETNSLGQTQSLASKIVSNETKILAVKQDADILKEFKETLTSSNNIVLDQYVDGFNAIKLANQDLIFLNSLINRNINSIRTENEYQSVIFNVLELIRNKEIKPYFNIFQLNLEEEDKTKSKCYLYWNNHNNWVNKTIQEFKADENSTDVLKEIAILEIQLTSFSEKLNYLITKFPNKENYYSFEFSKNLELSMILFRKDALDNKKWIVISVLVDFSPYFDISSFILNVTNNNDIISFLNYIILFINYINKDDIPFDDITLNDLYIIFMPSPKSYRL
jgi:hypothetical protein